MVNLEYPPSNQNPPPPEQNLPPAEIPPTNPPHKHKTPPVSPLTGMDKSVISIKAQQILIYLYTFISVILMFRFILSLIAARQETPFVRFVYQLSGPFMLPFANMFGRTLEAGGYRLEFEVLVALIVYAILFFGIAKLVSIIFD